MNANVAVNGRFRNKFIQNPNGDDFGKCLLFCFANLLNDEDILNHKPVTGKSIKENGCGPMDERIIIEKWSNGELTSHLLAKKPIAAGPLTESEIFSVDIDESYFVPMIAAVESPHFKEILHAILVIHDIKLKILIVLDPNYKFSIELDYISFLAKYKLYELSAFHDRKDGGGQSWGLNFFKHLID